MKSIEGPLVLAVDIGSSSTRAWVYDSRGRAVAGIGTQVDHALRTSVDGRSEDEAEAALARLVRCIDTVLAQAGHLAAEIRAVAVDTYVSNLLGVDAAGRALTPVLTYADTRNAADAETLRRDLDEQTVHQRTGCLLRTSYWPARLAWLRRTQPETWRTAARWITLGEYIESRLFGRSRVSLSVASWGGLLDRTRLMWDAPLLEHLGVDGSQLALLVDVDAPLSSLSRAYARRWPVLSKVPWLPAVGDGAAANVGSGCAQPDRIALTLGTTGALRTARPKVAAVPQGLWCYRIDRDLALLGGATSEGGNLYAWLRDLLRLGGGDATEAALGQCAPDRHGLTVLPFVAGERSPGWAGNVQATIHGLSLATAPLDILRAGMEAVAYRFALIAQPLLESGGADARIIASGGALHNSPAWCQIFADVLGRPVVLSAEAEATGRGTALLALRTIGAISAIDVLPAAEGRTFEPDLAHHAIYQAAIQRQQWLYDRLIPRQAR